VTTDTDELLARLQRTLPAMAASVSAPAGVLGVTINGHATIAYHGEPLPGNHTAFEIGSITKTVTALLLADMTGRGEVGYDDPISTHLPPHAVPADPIAAGITLRQLATHSAGLPPTPPNMTPPSAAGLNVGENPYQDYLLADLYRATAALTLDNAPGEQMTYSNFGAGLLGRLLANAVGRDWSDLVLERVCQPLGMHDTVTCHTTHCATGHRNGRAIAPIEMAALAPCGMLRCSPTDLLHYLHAQLDPDTSPLAGPLREVHQPYLPIEGRESICPGWRHRRFRYGEVLFHSGGTLGMTAFAGFCPDAAVGVFALVNGTHIEGGTVTQSAYDLLKELTRTHRNAPTLD
jgi:D-alanyl-D-alanine-carboxypeptidase/D-alanyl-D-alanine-endopeptidase